MIAPSLRHLRHLTALAEHRHFGRAAVASSVTQSTLSASIKELERLLEATLVDRSKRRVVFTPLGNETVERARKIVELVEELTNATLATREPLSGTLRMGIQSDDWPLPVAASIAGPSELLYSAKTLFG